jgi:hypothetical protein
MIKHTRDNNVMHAKPDLRVEFEPDDHFFRLGALCRYAATHHSYQFNKASDERDNQTGQSTSLAPLDPCSNVLGRELARFRARAEDTCCKGSPFAWGETESD